MSLLSLFLISSKIEHLLFLSHLCPSFFKCAACLCCLPMFSLNLVFPCQLWIVLFLNFLFKKFFIEVTLTYNIMFHVYHIIFLLLNAHQHAHHQNLFPIYLYTLGPLSPMCIPPCPFSFGNHYSVPYIHVCFVLAYSFIFYCLFVCIPPMSGIIQYLSISLSIIPLLSTHVVINGKTSSLLWLGSIYIYIYTHHPLYPFIFCWAVRFFPYVGYCK